MNKEQIINEAYVNYGQKIISEDLWMLVAIGWPSTQEEFIDKCKTNSEFSEEWGLKIEERELSMSEKELWYKNNNINPNEPWYPNFPTKLITITYNNKTIESYE